jgi:hypothetical protein
MIGNTYSREERLAFASDRGIVVDPEDQWLLEAYTWHISMNGYVRTTLPRWHNHLIVVLHHCLMGQPIDGSIIDHIDRNKLNNRRSNLRLAAYSQNNRNTIYSAGTTHISVTRNNTFQVRICRNSVIHHIGTYKTEQQAEDARDNWLIAWEESNA